MSELASRRVVQTLEELVFDDDQILVRDEALEALGELPDGAGLELLSRVARNHRDPAARQEAIEVLVDLGDDEPRAQRALELLVSP